MSDEFKWGEDDTVIHSVSAVAVYRNARGDAVIRQENSMDEDEMVIVPVAYLDVIIAALRAILDDAG